MRQALRGVARLASLGRIPAGGIRKASERRGKRTAQPNLDLFPLFSYHCTRYRDIVQPDMDTSTSR